MIHFINVGNGDAILIQSYKDDQYRNILIDGGKERNRLVYNKFKNEILSIIKNGKKGNLDLVIVTHSDDDHIGGILNIVGDPEVEKYVKKYIFHAEKYIAKKVQKEYKAREQYKVIPFSSSTVKSSYIQDEKLTQLLEKTPEAWDKKIYLAGNIINLPNAQLTFLSPTLEKLENLQTYWERAKKKICVTQKSSAKSSAYDYDTLFKEFYIKEEDFGGDSSETNGASIAFIYEDSNFRALLLADSHPAVVEKSLQELLIDGHSKHQFDIVKLSHHGSKNNITSDLLNLIDCQNFVISANADRSHRHPNKSTLAMILKHYGKDNVNFYFTNDNTKLREMFKNYYFSYGNKITLPYEY